MIGRGVLRSGANVYDARAVLPGEFVPAVYEAGKCRPLGP